MKKLRLAKSITKMMVKDRIQYPARLIVDTFGIVARYGILMVLYWYVFQFQGGEINNVTFQIVAWSMFLYFAFMTLRLRDLAKMIMNDIKSGAVETLLPKPINYLAYRIWWQFGAGLYPFIVTTILGVITLALTIGIPESMHSGFFVITLAVTFVFAAILSLLIYSAVGLFAFWIEEVKPLYWIVDKAVMILGGSYLPVALFPVIMYKIAIYSPFGASQFITHTVYDTWKVDFIKLIGIQLGWIIVIGILVFFLFNRAQRKVSVNGG